MRIRWKRLAAVLCAAVMALTLLPGQVWAEMYNAEEDTFLSATVVCGNPLYPEAGVEESVSYDAPTATLAEENALGDGGSYATAAEAAAYVRQQFKAREQMLFFYTGYPESGPFLELTEAEAAAAYTDAEQALVNGGASRESILRRRRFSKYLTELVRQQLLPEAFHHNAQDPTGGDYMRYQYEKVSYSASWDGYFFGVTITFTYFTTAQQEAVVDQTAEWLISSLGVADMADETDRMAAIYDWICAHVAYDHESTGTLKHSAYAALVDKTAVCQGYAVLLYRLALMAGVNARVVSGSVPAGLHGWNLVKIGARWYQADPTWDAGPMVHSHYLKAQLNNHQLDEESAAVAKQYFLSPTDFSVKIGALNGSGSIDSTDMQVLYDYLLTGAIPAAMEASTFRKAADINGDYAIDVYDLQLLYENISGIRE